MRGARYVRLIPWTLRSGSEHLQWRQWPVFHRQQSVSSILGLVLNSLQVFFTFSNYFTSRTNLSNTPQQSCKCRHQQNRIAECSHLLAFASCHRHYNFCGRLFAYGYLNISPHLLWLRPTLFIWALSVNCPADYRNVSGPADWKK